MDLPSGDGDLAEAGTTAELSLPEQLLVWGMRAWVAHFKQGRPPCAGYARAFALAGTASAAVHLDQLLSLLAAGAVRGIDVRCPPCPSLSPDEALLLDAVARLQHEPVPALPESLCALMTATAARAATAPLIRLSVALLAAGHHLPLRPQPSGAGAGPTPAREQIPAACCADPGALLVH